jgi:hypothetical protein
MKNLKIIIGALLLLAVGFAGGLFFYGRSQAPAIPIIGPAVPKIGPGERVVTFPEPLQGSPEPNPQLVVKATIRDAATGKPVVAAQVVLGGKVIAEQVSELEFTLPGEVDEHIFLEVHAPGYELWKAGFRHKLTHTRIYELPIKLQPVKTTPQPEA